MRPTIYPHIQLASSLTRSYIDDDEIAFRATHFDLAISRLRPDELRALNPNQYTFEYIIARFFLPGEIDRVEEWATQNGYDPEVMFLHYREDVAIPGREGQVLVPGYPAGVVPGWNPSGVGSPATATEKRHSRAVSYYLGTPPWYLANVDNPICRKYVVEKCRDLINGSYFGSPYLSGPVDGIMCDEAIYYSLVGDGILEKTIEYYGINVNDEHPYPVSIETSYQSMVQGLYSNYGTAKDVMPNYSHSFYLRYDNRSARNIQKITPWVLAEVWLQDTGSDGPTSGSNRCTTYDKDYDQAVRKIIEQTRAGNRRVLGARDRSSGTAGSDRTRMFMLGMYYIVHNRNTWLLYETGGPYGGRLETWGWNPAVTFDVGQPLVNDGGIIDYAGRSGTREHYEFASGLDPYAPALTYHVLARCFDNALVLVKMLPEGSVIDDRSITTHALDGQYAILQPDGNPGAVVTEVNLRNNEAVILISL
jgi:hypothetical protein